MAYDLKNLKGAPMPRYADHKANPEMLRGKDAIPQKQIEFLNGYLDILENQYYAQHPKERPMPPKGKLYSDQVGTLMNGRNSEFNVHPDTVLHVSDAEGVEDMKKIAAKIVESESLAEMSTKELNGALVMDKEKYMGTGLVVKGREAVLGKKEEDPELEQQKQKELEEEKLNPLETGFDLGRL